MVRWYGKAVKVDRAFAKLPRLTFLLPAGITCYLWIKGVQPDLPGWSCPLRALSGIPCPACFLTRATALALRGNLTDSLQLHAFGPPVALILMAWSVLALGQRRLRPVLPLRRTWRPGGRLAVATALAMGVYWLLRLALQAFPSG